MKKRVVIAVVASALLVLAGCLDQVGGGSSSYKGPLFRYHFTGRANLGKDGSATVLKQIDGMKETAALRAHFAERLGTAASALWKNDLPADATPQPELLRPLIEDLTSVEAVIEIHGPIGQTKTFIAAELSDQQARVWETNLVQLTRAWKLGTPSPVSADGAKGWAVKRAQSPGLLEVFRVGKWTIIGLGSERPAPVTAALQAAARGEKPVPAMNAILDLRADLPGLKKWAPVLGQFPLPPVHLTMTGRGENVRTEMRMMYSGKIPWKFEPWQIPTNLISEPLTSLTVAQGVRPFLEKFEGLASAGVPLPNQYCAWGLFHQYGHTYFAFPQRDASNTVARLAPKFSTLMGHYFDNPIGQFIYVTNRGEIVWGGGLPGVTPTLAPSSGPPGEFVYGRLFPLVGKRIPPPAELYSQFAGRSNLMYYDWELSSNRVAMARQLYQLGNIGDRRPPPSIETPSQQWLGAIAPKLGNAVTEVTLSSPQELLATRKSQIGLTGFELATLSMWLESSAFPYRIELPKPFKIPARQNAAPGVATPGRK